MTSQKNEITIKTESNLVTSARLSSFKGPRDLMLNNVNSKQISKKVFTPNLNVIRNKNKSGPIISNITKDRRKHDKHNGKDRSKGNNQIKSSNILKTTGVFSEGIAPSQKKISSREGYYTRGSRESIDTLQKPVYKEGKKIDKDFSNLNIKDYSSDEEKEDFSNNSHLPIRLPLTESGACLYQSSDMLINIKKEVKQELFIKKEPNDDTLSNTDIIEPKIGVIKKEPEESQNTSNWFENEKSSHFMIQFPDSLPGRGPDTMNTDPSSSSSNNDNKRNEENMCKFEHLQEGRIGKIVLYKSGKMKFKIGNMFYDLSVGSQTCFRQDVMSISVNKDEHTASMINLGKISTKMIVIPDWENIFESKETK